jgi:cytochrome c
MCFSQTSCLSRCRFGNKSRKFPEHLLEQKHCTLTLYVKAADFALRFFYPRYCAIANRTCCNAATPPETQENTATGLPSILLDWDGANELAIRAGTEKRTNRKEYEMRGVILAAVLAVMVTGGARAQDAAAGEKVFAVCKACHQIGETAKNAVGPVLNGIIGRPAGTYAGYSYSDANKNSGLTWDEATFRDYIKDPRAKIPGTKMIYPGLKDEQKTSDLLAYLKQFDTDGKKK